MSKETKSKKLEGKLKKLVDRMEHQTSDAAFGGDGDGDGGQDTAGVLGGGLSAEA